MRVEAGKSYTLAASGSYLASGSLNVSVPPQYRVVLNGVARSRCGLTGNVVIAVLPRNEGPPGAAGFASEHNPDRLDWRVPLGTLRNGDDAGSLRLVDSGTGADWSALFAPSGLTCEPTSDEVYVHRENNIIRQVIGNQVAIDVVVPPNTTDTYELRCYNPAQMTNATLPCTFTGQPFVTYTVRRSNDFGDPATALKIIRDFRNVTDATGNNFPVVRTESTKLVRTGAWPNFTWTKTDWHAGTAPLSETVATIAGTFNASSQLTNRTETISLRTPGSPPAVALTATRNFTTLGFGEALTAESVGTTNPRTAVFAYHSNPVNPGSFGFVESVQLPGGGWEAYDYHDSNQAMSFQGGRIKYRYRPFGPSASPVVTKNTSQGEVSYYEYGADPFGSNSRPTLVQTTINGTMVAKRTISYSSVDPEEVVTASQSDFASATVPLVTSTEYYSEGWSDAFLRGKPTQIRRPDGVMQQFSYEKGNWNGTVFQPNTEPNTASRISVTTVQPNGSPLNAVSTREVTIRDNRALVVRLESSVWSANTWNLTSWTNHTYNFAGLLTSRTSSNGATSSAVWNGNLKTQETDESGIVTDFVHDAAGRVVTATRAGATSGATVIAPLVTTYAYDAAGKVVQQRTGPAGGEGLLTITSHDDAGRVVSVTPPGLAATAHAYDVTARRHTITRPDGGTVVETLNLDGSMASRTGTGIVAQYFDYGIESDGRRWRKSSLAAGNSPRWTKTWTDWLGRQTTTQQPGFGGSPLIERTNVYDASLSSNTGRLLRTTAPGVAPTLVEYNVMSQIVRSGLDVDSSNSLVTTSTDRITDTSEIFEFFDGAWWLTKAESAYPYTGGSAGTAVQVAKSSRRLTGLGTTTATGVLREETRTWDVFNNETRRAVTVDTAARLATITTSRVGNTLTQVERLLNGLPISSKSFEGHTATFGYDALGRRNAASDPRTGTTTTTFHSNSTLVREVRDPANKRLSFAEYDGLGRVIFTKDAFDFTTRTAFTLRGEIAKTWGTAAYPVTYDYSDYGERTKMSTFQDAGNAAGTDTTTFPAVGQANETTWEFDAASGLLRKKHDAKVRFVEYAYDNAGRLFQRYWARTLPGSSTRVTTTYTYSNTTGEQIGITYNDGTPGLAYTYNRFGQTTGIVQSYTGSSIQTLLDYCLCGKLTAEYFDGAFFGGRNLAHSLSTVADGFKGRTMGYALTVGSTVEQATTYAYEASTGRFSSVATQGSNQPALTHTFSYAYLANSNIINALSVDSGHPFTVTRAFDDPGRDLLTSIETKWGSNPGTNSRVRFAYTYDDRRQRAKVAQSGSVFADYGGPSAGAIHQNFSYNGRGELTGAFTWLGDIAAGEPASSFMSARQHQFAYDGIGNRRSSNTSGVDALRDNYVVNELNQYVARENNTLAVGGTVADDAAIKVVAGASALVAAGRHGRHWGDNMLVDNLAGPYLGPVKFFAGKAGAGPGGTDLLKVVQRTAYLPPIWQVFTYDEDGNPLSDGVWNYTWDAENRLVAMETRSEAIGALSAADARRLEFKYDHLGRRIEKRVRSGWSAGTYGTTESHRRYLYNGWNLIAEYSVSGSTLTAVRTYTWGLDIVHTLSESGGVGALLQIADHATARAYFPAFDGNGNVAALLDGAASGGTAGAVVAAYEYSPYGEFLCSEGTYAKENPFRFSTKFTDEETGLVYYGRRYYSPSQGRFVGRDPKGEPGGINLYGFTANNPVNRWDVLGMNSPANSVPIMMDPFVVKEKKQVYTEVPIPGTEGFEVVWEEIDDEDDTGSSPSEAPNKSKKLNDCYSAARAAHSADTQKLGQIADARIESFFGSLAGQRSEGRAAFGEAVAWTVFNGAASVGIGAGVGAGASWQWAKTAAAGRNLYSAARSLQQVNVIAAEVAFLQRTANVVGGISGTAAAVGYNVWSANTGSDAAVGAGAELVDFAAGNRFNQTGLLLGVTKAGYEAIAASGLSDARAAGVVAGIRSSVGQTQQIVNGRLQSALSECDRKFK